MAEITKNLGTFEFAANFQVKAAEALDPRMVAASKADLINKSNWPSDGDTIYVYKGLIVDCGNDGVYRLIDPTKALATDFSGWERIDAKGILTEGTTVFAYKGSVINYEALLDIENPKAGDVYNVESETKITTKSELGDDIIQTYLAGTNWVYNGVAWDALAGAIDMSAYATKAELAQKASELTTAVNQNIQNINNVAEQLSAVQALAESKVSKEEGKTLISSEKLTLIDTNASDINILKGQQVVLDGRVATLEGFFEDNDGQGGSVNLSGITSQLSTLATSVSTLQNDKADKSDLTALTERVTAAEGVNATQASTLSTLSADVSGLSTEVAGLKTLANANQTNLSNLTGTVNTHTERLTTLETNYSTLNIKVEGKVDTSVYEAKVKELAQADTQVLADAKAYADTKEYDDSTLKARVKDNEDAIKVLNGSVTETGSVAKQVNDAINTFVNQVSDNNTVDTFKELIQYANTHKGEYTTLAGSVQANTNAIKGITDDYLKSSDKNALTNLIAQEAAKINGLASRLATVETSYAKTTELQALSQELTTTKESLEQADVEILAAAKTYTDGLFNWTDITE